MPQGKKPTGSVARPESGQYPITETTREDGEPHPIDIADLMAKEGIKANEENSKAITALIDLIGSTDPLYILGNVGFIFFLCQSNKAHVAEINQISLHHLELLQAHFLKDGREQIPELNHRPSSSTDKAIALIKQLAASAAAKRAYSNPSMNSASELHGTVEQVRSDTQFVRGTFHQYQSEKYLRAIFHYIDAQFEKVYNLSASKALDFLLSIVSLLEEKINLHRKLVHRVIRVHRAVDAIKTYCRVFPKELVRKQDIASFVKSHVKPKHVGLFLAEESLKFIPDAFCISADDIAEICAGQNIPLHTQLLNAWSLSFGSLQKVNPEHLYLDNPIRTQPFIKLETGYFFLPSPSTLYASCIEMFELLILGHPEIKTRYEDARATILELELSALLKRYLPDADVYSNIRWRDPISQQVFENDVLAILSGTAFLLEAKSGRITPQARRGADARLKREIEKLLVEPAQQSKRFQDYLTQHRGQLRLESNGEAVQFDSTNIKSFVRLNITFDTLGAAFSNWPRLIDAGLINEGEIQIPTMGIADLDVVLQILKDQPTIYHYLKRRGEFERNVPYLADEDDLIAFYLNTGFNIGEDEHNGTFIDMYGLSDAITPFFAKGRVIDARNLPRVKRSGLWQAIIKLLEASKPENWLDMAYQLLNFPFDMQSRLEEELLSIFKLVRNDQIEENFVARDFSLGSRDSRQSVLFCVYKNMGQGTTHLINQSAYVVMEKHRTNTCLVVGYDAFAPPAPYHMIRFIQKNQPT